MNIWCLGSPTKVDLGVGCPYILGELFRGVPVKRSSVAALSVCSLLATLAGCGGDQQLPVEPSPPIVSGPQSPPVFPTISRPSVIYNRVSESVFGNSRYVVYDDNTFTLQYLLASQVVLDYAGKYSGEPSALTFSFDASPTGWTAGAVIHGDSLIVKYNLTMSLSDFEDGVYVR